MLDLVAGFSRAQLAVAGLGAGIGLLVLGGKSMIDISEKQEAAHLSLAQAVDYYNSNLGKTTKAHEVYEVNARKSAAADQALAAARLAVARANGAVDVAQQTYTRDLYTYGPQSQKTMKAEVGLLDAKSRLSAAQANLNKINDSGVGTWVKVGATQARSKIDLDAYEKSLDTFIHTNKAYISDQSQVVSGAAQLVRSGLSQKEVQLDLSRALDLSAIKHISYSDAVDLVDQAEHGRTRGLIDLGIAQKNYVDGNGKALTGSKLLAAVMADLDKKTKGGRDTLTELVQDQNKLSNDWQDLAKKGGPALETVLDAIVTKVDDAYTALEKFGSDNVAWAGINNHLVDIAQAIHDNLLTPLQAVWDAYTGQKLPASPISKNAPTSIGGAPGGYKVGGGGPGNATLYRDKNGNLISVPPGQKPPPGATPVANGPQQSGSSVGGGDNAGRAAGGPVLPFHSYTVGEHGTEELVMGARGGYVIPHGGGGGSAAAGKSITIVVNVAGSVQTERSLNLAIREGLRRLDREHR